MIAGGSAPWPPLCRRQASPDIYMIAESPSGETKKHRSPIAAYVVAETTPWEAEETLKTPHLHCADTCGLIC